MEGKDFGVMRECAACGNKIKSGAHEFATGESCAGPLVPVCDACYEYARTRQSQSPDGCSDLWTAIKVRINSGAYYIPSLGKGVLP